MLRMKTSLLAAAAAFSLSAVACSDEELTDKGTQGVGQGDDDDDDNTAARPDAGKLKDGGVKDAGKLDASKPATADGGGSTGEKHVPCNVAKIVDAKCLTCHGEKLGAGVEFGLTSLASFQAAAVSDDKRKVHEVAYERVMSTTDRMPPPSVTISAADQKTLSDWLKGGAQGTTESCESSEPSVDGGTAPGPTGGTKSGASIEPVEYNDPLLKCYQFKGYTRGDKTKPYSVGTRPDFYVAFNFTPEFKGKQYLKSYRALVDNKEVIHHWLFFMQSGPAAEGVTENALGAHPDGQLLAGWAPGGDDMYFDPNIGMEISGDVSYQLENHYNNKTGSAKPDASGIEICVTPRKPEKLAAVSWLGTDAISGTSITGTCRPNNTQPVHLVAGSPHMHVKGTHMKVVINRKDGTKETLHDEPFQFEYQRQYLLNDVVINPGDTISTTCTYSAPARFGKGTNDEMCYFFTTHWPANTLTSIGIGSVIHGPNSCLD